MSDLPPPTQPIFIVGTTYSAPITVLDQNGAVIPSPTGLSASADSASVATSVSGSSLLASISVGGVTSVITVSIPGADGAVVSGTVTVSDGPLPPPVQVPTSLSIGLFTAVPASATGGAIPA